MIKKVYKIVKRVEAKDINDAIKREKKGEITDVFVDIKSTAEENKKLGFNNDKK